MLNCCSAEERHAASFIYQSLSQFVAIALSKEWRGAAPFAQEWVHSALPEERVDPRPLAEEWIFALLGFDVIKQLVVEASEAAFGDRSVFCVDLVSTVGVDQDIAAALVDVLLPAAASLTQLCHTTAGTGVVMRG